MAPAFAPATTAAFSDDSRRDLDATGSPIQRTPVDPRIAEALSHISAAQIQHTIGYVARVTRINAATMAKLAAAPLPPVKVGIVVGNLDNNTTSQWTAGPRASTDTHYEVLWRELAAPDWQRFTSKGIQTPADGRGIFGDAAHFER
jgi:hypothetical protein